MLTINVESLLIAILLVVAIVAVIYMIVLLSKAITTVDKVNKILDDSTLAVRDVARQVTSAFDVARDQGSKVSGVARTGFAAARSVASKFKIKKK